MYLSLICLFVCLLNLILIFFAGIFLVRFQQSLFKYLDMLKNDIFIKNNLSENKEDYTSKKTWDQKYEEEMNELRKRMKEENEQ